MNSQQYWPSLPYDAWQDTLQTLHLWTQIVGKIKLKLCPFLNQWWEVALAVTPRGLTTGRIPYKTLAFSIDFDFITHTLAIATDCGDARTISLHPRSVAAMYQIVMQTLQLFGIKITITNTPSEIPNPIPFAKDTMHASYDRIAVEKWFRILLHSSLSLDYYRTPFRGKSSPVQFFWGSFDLNTTRFSGKKLPEKTNWPKGSHFMRYAENEENFSVGFWPGDKRFTAPAFYAYMYPAPKGFETLKPGPPIAQYNSSLSEYVLPYEAVRRSRHPEKEIMKFLQTTYTETATLARWNIKELSGVVPPL